MENASKALIIAGAILLSILLISLGIMVFQQAKGTASSSNLDSTQMEALNSKWESYTARTQTATDIRSMISALITYNANESNSGDARYVSVTYSGTTYPGDPSNENALSKKQSAITGSAGVKNGTRYTVTATYADTGLITGLTISSS